MKVKRQINYYGQCGDYHFRFGHKHGQPFVELRQTKRIVGIVYRTLVFRRLTDSLSHAITLLEEHGIKPYRLIGMISEDSVCRH